MIEESPTKARGKWAHAGVPHKGWMCASVLDLREEGQDYLICEMCEAQEIRFVHTMEHPEYPGSLDCGCDCAGYMEGNRKRAKKREASARNRAARRQKFPDRKAWKASPRGTPHISVDGFHCMIAKPRRGGGFSVGITPLGADEPIWGDKTYGNLREAQMGCFDAIEYMKSRLTPE